MDLALIVSASLLGLAGAPHCTAMCSAPCAAAVGRGDAASTAAFHLARVAGYAAGGAIAASSVAALAAWSQLSPGVRPLWVLVHMAALALGLWLLLKGRQPGWLATLGRVPPLAPAAPGWQRMQGPARAAAAGGLWVAWPCGLLHSALLVAAMANSGAAGAAARMGFAVASSPGLLLGPWAWRHLLQGGDAAVRQRQATRAGGLLLVAASAWALGHGVWEQVAAICATL